jgi:hypothetical protein
MKAKARTMTLHRETLRRLTLAQIEQAAGATGTGCYPPTFAPTCYAGCPTATCPDICY